ncbi:phosphate ABC transporter substrate-binding protein [Permianibacter sp. IMCC34836]|uniref:phosphate ABC transporter substrate-binding protein n=1 Tax=Permianibacter fluminis TaxID=2738515 RepID=UPI001556288B|nr:phosphate ABC transporter substrate-binding protein [Permianibacter fluminis]NQD38273.1 phosphate ABC transporter substrate-binding protein [Permianibacter fluminis]
MKKLLLVCLIALTAGIAGAALWLRTDAAEQRASKDAPPAIALRIHGSNTVGEKLMPALVTAFLEQRGYAVVRTQIGAEPVEKTVLARSHPSRPALAVEIHAHGSSTAFQDLEKGLTDLGMASRKIKTEELDKLKDRYGDLSDAKQEHVIALDALAIIVHPDNPLEQLTVEQIAGIFAGEISDWSQLGLPAGAIALYARDDKSGTWDTFENLVLKKFDKKLLGSARRFESSDQLTESVRKDRNGIGFVGVAYANRAKLLGVSADGKKAFTKPGKHSIGTEDYALSRRLFVYEPAGLNNELARDFLAFAVSDAGQKLVEASGLISYYPTRDKPRIALQPYPARYQSLGTLGERLSVNFRVEDNALLQDSKLNRDLGRVANFFRDHPDKHLVLAELSPPTTGKNRGSNEALSQLERLLAASDLTPFDRVKVEHGPDNFAATASQIEIWAL